LHGSSPLQPISTVSQHTRIVIIRVGVSAG
jgi:hypothetical protein